MIGHCFNRNDSTVPSFTKPVADAGHHTGPASGLDQAVGHLKHRMHEGNEVLETRLHEWLVWACGYVRASVREHSNRGGSSTPFSPKGFVHDSFLQYYVSHLHKYIEAQIVDVVDVTQSKQAGEQAAGQHAHGQVQPDGHALPDDAAAWKWWHHINQ